MTIDAEIAAFVKQRDIYLQSDDPDDWRRLYDLAGQEVPRDMAVFELSVMKSRTGALSLPLEFRKKAADWLRARGSTPLADDV